jgi:ectoine hydroxylase-related dioxygenase (phytanoyl-CoA dioxygenase family)
MDRDAVAFNFRTLHGARGNTTANRRRAFSLRLVGEDARYVERPGRTSPPFPGHGMHWRPAARGPVPGPERRPLTVERHA